MLIKGRSGGAGVAPSDRTGGGWCALMNWRGERIPRARCGCFTPVRSPQSNGIAEAFVKTFKRDYARLSARPDATAVLADLDRWFEDYNEMHPHRALGMRSPRQFIRAHQPATCPV
jgi:transposase InsO family protein